MAIIAMPAGISFRNVKWAQPPVEQVNRSVWSGRTRIVQFGAAARWNATGELPPLKPDRHLAWTAFVMQLHGRLNTFAMPVGEADQHNLPITAPTVAAGSSGYTLNVKGLAAAAVRVLEAGHYVTVVYNSGDRQLVGLTSPMDSTVDGTATVSLATPLRENPFDGNTIEIKTPYALMRAIDPQSWSVEPGRIYTRTLAMEEAF